MLKNIITFLFIFNSCFVYAQRSVKKWNILPNVGLNYTFMSALRSSYLRSQTKYYKNIANANAQYGLYIDYVLNNKKINKNHLKDYEPFAFKKIHSIRFGVENCAHTSEFEFKDPNFFLDNKSLIKLAEFPSIYNFKFTIRKWSLPVLYQIKLTKRIRLGLGFSLNYNKFSKMKLNLYSMPLELDGLRFFPNLRGDDNYTKQLNKFQLGAVFSSDFKLYRRLILNIKAQTYFNNVLKPNPEFVFENNFIQMSNIQIGIMYQLFKEYQ